MDFEVTQANRHFGKNIPETNYKEQPNCFLFKLFLSKAKPLKYFRKTVIDWRETDALFLPFKGGLIFSQLNFTGNMRSSLESSLESCLELYL